MKKLMMVVGGKKRKNMKLDILAEVSKEI